MNTPRRPLEDARLTITRLSSKKLGLAAIFQEICKIAAEAIAVERVGVWLFIDEGAAIRCACLYESTKGKYSEGAILRRIDFPNYFAHLLIRKTIPAESANIDPRTNELEAAYLLPLGITSLLDGVIYQQDAAVGIVCHEHTGPAREWTTEERDFVGSVADLLALKIQGAKLAEVQLQLLQTSGDQNAYQQRSKMAQMAAGVAHDFRNLLTVIQGGANLIEAHSTADSVQAKMAGMILNASKRGEELSRDIMALSANHARNPVVLDLSAVLAQFLPLLVQTAGSRHQLEARLPTDLGRVFVDRLLLERVVLNLVVNARDAMPQGGPIRVSISNSPWDNRGILGDSVILEVADQGTGIQPALRERIFEPFFTTKPRDQGTGLGLAIVKSGIELSGGKVELVSEIGKGSTFRVFLPCVSCAAGVTGGVS